MEERRPIGYWLRLLDQLIEEHINRVLAVQNLHRRHWQTMNLLRPAPAGDRTGRRGPAAKQDIEQRLRPFWAGSPVSVDRVLDDLVRRAWITGREPYALTPAGETAHAALARIVERAGRQIDDGVTAKEHDGAVEVLRRMVANAERLRPPAREGTARRL